MMNKHYAFLFEIYSLQEVSLSAKYRLLRGFLERLCQDVQPSHIQLADLAARINYLVSQYKIDTIQKNRLHTFRLTSNRILNQEQPAEISLILRDIRVLALTVKKIFGEDIPEELDAVLPELSSYTPLGIFGKQDRIKRLRVCFQHADSTYLYVTPTDHVSDDLLRVRYNIQGINMEFARTVEQLWPCARLNLLDVSVDQEGIYTPFFIILEPDYLIDISSLAECFKEYGSHPANYNLSKLVPTSSSGPLLLGNIANLFLDEWVHADGEIDYRTCMQKAFRTYPIELAACEDLLDPEKEAPFFADCRMHFEHIRQTVKKTFRESGYNLDPKDAVLEPSYICEPLGIQGRLDYMQRDMSSFIEMKSGKADEYSVRNKITPKENNKIQMLLYLAVLEFNMGKSHRQVHPYLLYTRYPLLYPANTSWALVRRVMNVRNLIVAGEYAVQQHNDPVYTARVLGQINPQLINERGLQGKLWNQYLSPVIEDYRNKFSSLNGLEQSYFLSLYNFISKELYISKSGNIDYSGKIGAASLWLATLAEKQEAGEILYNLKIVENRAADSHKAFITLSIPVYQEDFLPNFRVGDIVVLYERNTDQDNVTNKMVFKGCIEFLTEREIKIRIRAPQKNAALFPFDSLYAVEHDSMDISYRYMYQSLYTFMSANPDRRKLLLSQRPPAFDRTYQKKIETASDDFERVALKAESAKDCFLLVGPPGTGKTSCALRRMVERFYAMPQKQILLLAYTNRAVDEICKSISSISPAIDYIRIGSELSCEAAYRPHLVENRLISCNRRSEVMERISECRVFVGTVSSLAIKPDFFRLKSFDVAIVDEATQILEPQLLGILCAKNKKGDNAIGKFILIGDHKQLPAVVLQNKEQSAVSDKRLHEIGLENLRDSLFERLYRIYKTEEESWAVDILCKQGRMNPAITYFPNQAFYGGRLQSVGLLHQTEELSFPKNWGKDKWEELLMHRLAFIPSLPDRSGSNGKTNLQEAQIVAHLAEKVYRLYGNSFDVSQTLGIITPYRSQIALIKKELSRFSIPALNQIAVDTVERFQGSERDIIFYSACVNYPWQLDFLINLIKEEDICIDRKLNVVLTRARKQFFITGVENILKTNSIYRELLNSMN